MGRCPMGNQNALDDGPQTVSGRHQQQVTSHQQLHAKQVVTLQGNLAGYQQQMAQQLLVPVSRLG